MTMYANLTRTIETLNPCPMGLNWIRRQTDARSAWRTCRDPGNMLWLASVLLIKVGDIPAGRAIWAHAYRRRGLPESFVVEYERLDTDRNAYCHEIGALTPAQSTLRHTAPTCADIRAAISEDTIVNALLDQARKFGIPLYTSPGDVK